MCGLALSFEKGAFENAADRVSYNSTDFLRRETLLTGNLGYIFGAASRQTRAINDGTKPNINERTSSASGASASTGPGASSGSSTADGDDKPRRHAGADEQA